MDFGTQESAARSASVTDVAIPGVTAGEPDAAFALARSFLEIRSEDLPPDAVDATKKALIDCLGVLIAGSTTQSGSTVAAQVAEWGGRPEATVLVYGDRVPAVWAAFANSTMARALDLDDVYEPAVNHPTSSVVPTALAMAERQGGASGREVLAAIALGRDLICRLSLANRNLRGERGRSQSIPYNAFACAGVAGRFLALTTEQLVNAMGLTYGESLSNRQGVIEGRHSISVHQGLTAEVGVLAAQLAARGLTGAQGVLEGKYGYYRMYEAGLYDREMLLQDLGRRFTGLDSSIKPYACCKQSHTAVDAAVEVRRALAGEVDRIESIRLGVNEDAYYTVCFPLDGRLAPRSTMDAQFSAQWAVATAFASGTFTLDDLETAALVNERTRALAAKVECYVDEAIEAESFGRISPAVVEVRTRDGRTVRSRCDYVKGHPQNPMSLDEVVAKFRQCLGHAARPLDPARAERGIDLLLRLEKVQDVGEVIAAFI